MMKFKPNTTKSRLIQTGVRFTPEELEAIKVAAGKWDMKHAEFIRQGVMFAIKNMESE